MTGLGYGNSDRETQALDSSGPGACPVSTIYLIAGVGTNFPRPEGGVDKGRRRAGRRGARTEAKWRRDLGVGPPIWRRRSGLMQIPSIAGLLAEVDPEGTSKNHKL
jgi:hypothetical protein